MSAFFSAMTALPTHSGALTLLVLRPCNVVPTAIPTVAAAADAGAADAGAVVAGAGVAAAVVAAAGVAAAVVASAEGTRPPPSTSDDTRLPALLITALPVVARPLCLILAEAEAEA